MLQSSPTKVLIACKTMWTRSSKHEKTRGKELARVPGAGILLWCVMGAAAPKKVPNGTLSATQYLKGTLGIF